MILSNAYFVKNNISYPMARIICHNPYFMGLSSFLIIKNYETKLKVSIWNKVCIHKYYDTVAREESVMNQVVDNAIKNKSI